MLSMLFIRENSEKVKKAMRNRNKNMDNQIDELVQIDKKRRELILKVESLKAEQNSKTKQIPQLKKEGKNISELLSELKNLSDLISEMTVILNKIKEKQEKILLSIPNVPHDSVPVGLSDTDNVEIRKYKVPRNFDFNPKPHWDIGTNLDILDQERATKVTGTRFTFYKGLGAKLERSIINFCLDTHVKNGYKEVLPPYIVNRSSMTGTGQLPKFEDDAFKISNTDYFLIPTAEVPVTNLHRNEILDGDSLTIKYCAYSACFRSEAGSAGRDTRGIIRQHQFNKVELVKFSKNDNSYAELESLTLDAERVLKLLQLPYRVVSLCTADLGFTAAKTYDIEVWLPSYNKYVEISSCSNFEDFQARRASIRYKDNIKEKAKFVHTLNGSGLAIGRTVAAILENYQNEDGSVTIPDVLVPYMGCTKITVL